MKRVVWLSPHKPLPVQLKELRRIFEEQFGESIEVILERNTCQDYREIISALDKHQADDFVAVLPLSILEVLCKEGKKPLWVEMQRVRSGQGHDLSYSGRHYKFIGFKRIKSIEITFSDSLFG